MYYLNLDEKDKNYYTEVFKIETLKKLSFYKFDTETHRKNIRRLETEIEEEKQYISGNEKEIDDIEAKLADPDGQAKRLLFKDFKSAISDIMNGGESQQNARFGLKIQRHGPYSIEKPISVTSGGKKITEVRKFSVMKFRDNEIALGKFRAYLREGANLPIDNLTFDELKVAIEKFFSEAPDVDVYGEEYEQESFTSNSVRTTDSLFRI